MAGKGNRCSGRSETLMCTMCVADSNLHSLMYLLNILHILTDHIQQRLKNLITKKKKKLIYSHLKKETIKVHTVTPPDPRSIMGKTSNGRKPLGVLLFPY